jgi:type IV pilus biogenesis protein CpaD/CtpE
LPNKFYLDRDASEVQGTLPASNATVSATTPTYTPGVTNGTAVTPLLANHALNPNIGLFNQTSLAYASAAVTTNQRQPLLCFASMPLAAQTIAAQALTISVGFGCSSTVTAFQISAVLAVWRPGTGALVGRIHDLTTSSASATASQTVLTLNIPSGSTAAVTAQAGDVLILEIWRNATVQTMGTSYTNTVYYDGTTEASTSNIAAYLLFTNNVTLQTLPAEITLRAITGGNGSSGPMTVPLPAGTTDGDLLVMFAEANPASGAGGPLTPPAGWTKGTTFSATGTSGFSCFYWAQYSAALSLSFTNLSGSSWCVGAYYKTGAIVDVDGAAVVTYVTANNTTVNTGQPVTSVAGDYELLGYQYGISGGNPLPTAGVNIDIASTSGVPTSQSLLGHYLVHPLGAGVTCPNFALTLPSSIANKTGAGLLLKAAPLITEPATPTLGGPVDNFEA